MSLSAAEAGTFTPTDDKLRGYDLTLIEAEAVDDVRVPSTRTLDYDDARRNIVTRGIDLNAASWVEGFGLETLSASDNVSANPAHTWSASLTRAPCAH